MSKRPLACLTIARNESYWLPRWIKHYGRTGAALYILDHESDDGSTAGIPAAVTQVSRPHTDDVGWMLQTIERHFADLCEGFERVIFAECDEFLVPDPAFGFAGLGDYLRATPRGPLRATGFDVCPGGAWKRNEMWDKTLVAEMPMRWEVGFHRPHHDMRLDLAPDGRLLLLHGHYMDCETQWKRLEGRRKGRDPYPNDWGIQNKYATMQEFDADFARATAGAYPMPPTVAALVREIM